MERKTSVFLLILYIRNTTPWLTLNILRHNPISLKSYCCPSAGLSNPKTIRSAAFIEISHSTRRMGGTLENVSIEVIDVIWNMR